MIEGTADEMEQYTIMTAEARQQRPEERTDSHKNILSKSCVGKAKMPTPWRGSASLLKKKPEEVAVERVARPLADGAEGPAWELRKQEEAELPRCFQINEGDAPR